jgi:hypothetical protein
VLRAAQIIQALDLLQVRKAGNLDTSSALKIQHLHQLWAEEKEASLSNPATVNEKAHLLVTWQRVPRLKGTEAAHLGPIIPIITLL